MIQNKMIQNKPYSSLDVQGGLEQATVFDLGLILDLVLDLM